MDNVEQYIKQFEPDLQLRLFQLRDIILQTVPDVEEKISWGVPTYNNHGFLVQFAVNKHHIGFYCSPTTIQHFQKELLPYSTNKKNTIRFSFNQEIPCSLIQQILLLRIKENNQGAD